MTALCLQCCWRYGVWRYRQTVSGTVGRGWPRREGRGKVDRAGRREDGRSSFHTKTTPHSTHHSLQSINAIHSPALLLHQTGYTLRSRRASLLLNSSLERLRVRADHLTHLLSILEDKKGGHGADADFLRDVGDFVDVDLDEVRGGVLVGEPGRR